MKVWGYKIISIKNKVLIFFLTQKTNTLIYYSFFRQDNKPIGWLTLNIFLRMLYISFIVRDIQYQSVYGKASPDCFHVWVLSNN
jgi:hypothetical protein